MINVSSPTKATLCDLDLKVIEDAEALANELDHTVRHCRARFILEHDFKSDCRDTRWPVIIENRVDRNSVIFVEFDCCPTPTVDAL